MANLKRNSIKLFKELKDDEVVTQTYFSLPFLPLSVVYEACDLMGKYEELEKENKQLTSPQIREYLEEMADFIADRVYGKQFTKEELEQRLHAPDAYAALQEQIMFVAWGMQNESGKKFQAKKA